MAKIILSIAGSDSIAGAGIQADLKTISSLGAYGTTAITAVTAQNTQKVWGIHPVPSSMVRKQIEAVLDDFRVHAIKVGMLHNTDNIFAIAKALSNSKHPRVPIILDPVMVATSGDSLSENDDLCDLIKSQLFPVSLLVTPNIDEASKLCGYPINSLQDAQLAAKDLLKWGCYGVLIKGGHAQTPGIHNVYFTQNHSTPEVITHERIPTDQTHGTGCTLSAAIATYFAQTGNLSKSVSMGLDYVIQSLRQTPKNIAKGAKPLNHFFNPKKMML